MSQTVLDEGFVTHVEGDVAYVSLLENEECEECGARILCAPDQSGQRGVLARNSAGAKVGQKVQVTESGDLLLKLSLMQYGLPLLGFLLGVIVLYWGNFSVPGVPGEVIWFLGGIAGLGLSGAVSWQWARGAAQSKTNYFEISKIYANGSMNHEKSE